MGFQKGRCGRPKIHLLSKVAKFAGQIGIDLTFIFFVRILAFEILSLLVIFVFKFYKLFPECFRSFFLMMLKKMVARRYDCSYCIPEFF